MEFLRTGHAMLPQLCKHGYGCYGERIDGVEASWSASDGMCGVDFLLCKIGGVYIASFRCVENIDIMLSYDWTLVPCPYFRDGHASAAACITDLYTSIRDDATDLMSEHAKPGRRIVFCGYSMGAALAALAAVDHTDFFSPKPYLAMYGCPRVGDRRFVEAVADSCSMIEEILLPEDPISYFPTGDCYCRFVSTYGKTRFSSFPLVARIYLMSIYARLMGKQASWVGETVIAEAARHGDHDISGYLSASRH